MSDVTDSLNALALMSMSDLNRIGAHQRVLGPRVLFSIRDGLMRMQRQSMSDIEFELLFDFCTDY